MLLNNEDCHICSKDGIFVLENRRANIFPWKLSRVVRKKTYGATEVLFLPVCKMQSAISNQMIRFIYNMLLADRAVFFFPGYFAKMIRRGGYREKFGQRLGIYAASAENPFESTLDLATRGERRRRKIALKLAMRYARSKTDFTGC